MGSFGNRENWPTAKIATPFHYLYLGAELSNWGGGFQHHITFSLELGSKTWRFQPPRKLLPHETFSPLSVPSKPCALPALLVPFFSMLLLHTPSCCPSFLGRLPFLPELQLLFLLPPLPAPALLFLLPLQCFSLLLFVEFLTALQQLGHYDPASIL